MRLCKKILCFKIALYVLGDWSGGVFIAFFHSRTIIYISIETMQQRPVEDEMSKWHLKTSNKFEWREKIIKIGNSPFKTVWLTKKRIQNTLE